MPLLDLIAFARTLKDATGSITIVTDSIYPTQVNHPEIEYGFCVRVSAPHAPCVGWGLTLEEAAQRTLVKLRKKFPVV